MNRKIHFGIQSRLLLLALLPAIVIALFLTVHHSRERIEAIDKLNLDRAKAIAEQVAAENINPLFTNNQQQINENIQRYLEQYDELHKIKISENEKITAHFEQFQQLSKKTIYSSAPIILKTIPSALDDFEETSLNEETSIEKNIKIGEVEIWLNDLSDAEKEAIIQSAVIILTMVVTISVFVVFYMSRAITSPLRELVASFDSLGHGNYHIRVEEKATDELLLLQQGFNQMSSALEKHRDKLYEEVEHVTHDLNTTLQALEIQNVELDIARKQAVESSRIKSEFLANMSHEIRTPMNGIIGFIALLQNTPISNLQKNYVDTISYSANSLLQILNDILDYSKLEAGKIEQLNEEFIIEDAIAQVLDTFTPLAYKKQLNLIPLIFNDVPRQVYGDRQHIMQVLSNLLSNAIKFTDQGDIVLRVAVEEQKDTQYQITFSVSDTGIGISPEDQRRLFEPFTQADSDFSRGFGGTGLGLSISKSLVEIMEGSLSLTSVPDEGSTFSMTLPLIDRTPNAASIEIEPGLQNSNIILYDRHRLSRLSLSNTLQTSGFTVIEASNDKEFIQLSRQNDCEFIIVSLSTEQLEETGQLLNHADSGAPNLLLLIPSSDNSVLQQFAKNCQCRVMEKNLFAKKLLPELLEISRGAKPVQTLANDEQTSHIDTKLNDYRILVVDDNEINQQLLSSVLTRHGAAVSSAHNGRQALQLINSSDFDLVFMDIHMPEMNGIECVKQIRLSGITTPVIALTADVAFIDERQVAEYGFDSVLLKPLDMQQFEKLTGDFVAGKPFKLQNPDLEENSINQQANQQQLPIRDLQQALRITDGQQDVADKLLQELLRQLPGYLQTARTLNQEKNWDKLWQTLHKLHGATTVCGVPALNETVKNAQKALDRETYAILDGLLDEIETQNKILADYLRKNVHEESSEKS